MAKPKLAPPCPRCGQQRELAPGCMARPGAVRFGMEAPGEPGSVVALATRCPDCQTPRGAYHHAGCEFERRRAG
jgi:NAD-dependent SIR2 family protein deacetylase